MEGAKKRSAALCGVLWRQRRVPQGWDPGHRELWAQRGCGGRALCPERSTCGTPGPVTPLPFAQHWDPCLCSNWNYWDLQQYTPKPNYIEPEQNMHINRNQNQWELWNQITSETALGKPLPFSWKPTLCFSAFHFRRQSSEWETYKQKYLQLPRQLPLNRNDPPHAGHVYSPYLPPNTFLLC